MKPLHKRISIYAAPHIHFNISDTVGAFFGLEKGIIYSRSRKRKIALPRQIVMWLDYSQRMQFYNKPSLNEIASKFPGETSETMDHASVLHAVKNINNLMEYDRDFRCSIYKLQKQIFGNVPFVLSKK